MINPKLFLQIVKLETYRASRLRSDVEGSCTDGGADDEIRRPVCPPA